MNRAIPCVLMRAGTSRGPFFLREWLPADDHERDEALIGAIGASDLLQVDGVGGGSTLTSKVAIVSKSSSRGATSTTSSPRSASARSRSTRGPTAATCSPASARSPSSRASCRRRTARRRCACSTSTRGRGSTSKCSPPTGASPTTARRGSMAWPARRRRSGSNFLDAWGAVTGSLFPTGRRIDTIEGVQVTCIDAAMPLVIVQRPRPRPERP